MIRNSFGMDSLKTSVGNLILNWLNYSKDCLKKILKKDGQPNNV